MGAHALRRPRDLTLGERGIAATRNRAVVIKLPVRRETRGAQWAPTRSQPRELSGHVGCSVTERDHAGLRFATSHRDLREPSRRPLYRLGKAVGMNPFTHVLVPVDFGEATRPSLDLALSMA